MCGTVLVLTWCAAVAGWPHEDAELLRVLDLKPGMMVADVGCGRGRITELVAREVGPEGLVFAVEIDEKLVGEVSERGIPNVLAVLSMPNDVSLEPGSLDLAFMHDVAAHVKRAARPEFYASVAKALRPEGVLVIFGHHADTHEIFEEVGRYGFRPEDPRASAESTAHELDALMDAGVRFQYLPSSGELEVDLIEGITRAKGRFDAAALSLQVALPREDVAVLVEGRALGPFMVASRGTFRATGNAQVDLEAEFALFDDELDRALDTALAHGLTVTALHDHFLHEEPPTRFMHARGAGETTRLARAFRSVLDEVTDWRASTPMGSSPPAFAGTLPGTPTRALLEEVLGFEVPQRGADLAFELESVAGMTSRAVFSGGDERTRVEGRCACSAMELRPLLSALRQGGLHVWAVHPPRDESDPVTFVHYRGIGRARDLASAVRDGLEAQRDAARQ
jgi:SAM-dependent methyltransferase